MVQFIEIYQKHFLLELVLLQVEVPENLAKEVSCFCH